MYRTLLLPLVLFLIGSRIHSQNNYSIKGKIVNSKQEAVANASVHVLNTNRFAIAGQDGSFSIWNIPGGRYIISVSAAGYARKNIEAIISNQPTELIIQIVEAARQLDAVVITADKSEATVQQLPVSISVISAGQVRDLGIWNTKEITAIVPTLFSSNPGDNRNVTSLRGISSSSYDPAIATYIDGVNQFGLDTYIAQLLDVERIEILRGPQGTLYGRNAMGGVINIITKQLSARTGGFAEFTAGNYNLQRYTSGFHMPIAGNKIHLGAALQYNKRNGFYTNEFNNSSYDRQYSFTANSYLRYMPDENWRLILNIKHQQNRNHGSFPLVFGTEEAFRNPFKLNQDAITKMIDNIFNASITVQRTAHAFDLTSQTAYQFNHRYYGSRWNKVKVFTQEIRLNSPASHSFKWTGGFYFFYQANPVKQATRFGRQAPLMGVPDSLFSIINTSTGKNYGFSFFGQISQKLNKRLELIAGLRYDREYKKQSVLGEYQKDPDPEPQFAVRPDTTARTGFHSVSPKLGLLYQLNRGSNLYFNFSRGFRAGGFTQFTSDPTQPPLFAYAPEYSNNVELGMKNIFFDQKLQLNLSCFYTTVKDIQVPALVLPDAITITKNAGKLHSKGIEAEVMSKPLNGLTVLSSFGYTKAEFKKLKIAKNGQEIDLEGKRQIFTPDVTSFLALQYSIPVNKKKDTRFTATIDWRYIGLQYFDLINTIRQTPVHLFNAEAGVTAGKIRLSAWMKNLTNNRYIDYAYDFGAVHMADPRTFGLSASVTF